MNSGIRQRNPRAAPLILALLFSWPLAGPAQEAEQGTAEAHAQWRALPEPDTSDWRCRLCPFAGGWNGVLDAGVGYVNHDSFRFGDYRGLEEEGFFPVAGGDLRYWGEDAAFVDLRASELGLDSRELQLEAGRQGRYSFHLSWDEVPHLISDETRTVYTGDDPLRLPPGWVRADTTGGMTALSASLHETRLEQQRESLGIGVDFFAAEHWHTSLEYRRDTREGQWARGGSFLFNSVLLPAPVDYRTERMDAAVGYEREYWQMEAAYHASLFTNENDALVWDNPFNSSNGADEGRAATAPDNQFHQFLLSGAWRSPGTLTLAGRMALGRMEQDEDFLPATINAGLSVPPLPGEDLDGRVDTRTADLRISGRPLQRLGIKLELGHDERDNDTPRREWTQVATDEIVSDARFNRPYGYEKDEGTLTLDYRLSGQLQISGAAGREEVDRSFQETDQTVTDRFQVGLRARPVERLDMEVQESLERRSGAHDPLGLMPPEHPGMRKYHLADRERHARRLRLDFLATEKVSLGLSAERAHDDYEHSQVGLTGAEEVLAALDLSWSPVPGIAANAFLSLQSSEADIRGQDNLTGAPWKANQEDRYRTLGLGLVVDDLPGRFREAGLELTRATGTTDIDMDKFGVSAPPFPELETRLYTLNAHTEYGLRENLDLRLDYLLEGFREDDFQRDGVAPDTIPSILTLGGGSPGYSVQVIRLSGRYRF